MGKKLLNKTLAVNLLFSFVVLLVAAPLFYFATQKLYLEETDETLGLRKNDFLHVLKTQFKPGDISAWNRMNRDSKIKLNISGISKDTLFFQTFFDSAAMEDEYCRVMESPVKIDGMNYLLESRISLVEREDMEENIAKLFIGVLVFLLIGFYLITWAMSRKLWKPFYDTLEKIENFEIDKFAPISFSKHGVDEFKRLNHAIIKLIERNTAIFKSQREFVENAAHELQTPLAVFMAKVDTLIQRSDINEEQATLLSQLNDAADRLNKLNKNLLLLSKIESYQYNEREAVVLNAVFERQIDFFEEQARAKNIAIDLHLMDRTELRTDHILLEVFISNLFLNAIRHNIQNGSIFIKLKDGRLLFSNSGEAFELDEGKLFRRFARVHLSSSGNGLGLAIIKKIADINGWNIHYYFSDNRHNFEIIF